MDNSVRVLWSWDRPPAISPRSRGLHVVPGLMAVPSSVLAFQRHELAFEQELPELEKLLKEPLG